MKKTKLWLASIFMMVALLFVSCGGSVNGTDDGTVTGDEEGPKTENGETTLTAKKSDKFSFSMGGMNALAIVDDDGTPRSARSVKGARAADSFSDALIVKILEDGTMESFLSVPDNVYLSKICYIARSPIADAKEIYIVFQSETSWGENVYNEDGTWKEWKNYSIGQLVCVKEDGSFIDILEKEDGTHKWLYNAERDSIFFDQNGDVYYLVNEGNGSDYTNMIYKFNPRTGKSNQLTSPVPNTYYDKMLISKDGQWIFAKGGRWNQNSSTQFLRAIPTATPDFPINIFYESNNSNWLSDWYYDDDTKAIYYIQNSALYRIAQKDGTFDKANKEELFSSDNGGYSNFWSDALLSWNSSEYVTWRGCNDYDSVYDIDDDDDDVTNNLDYRIYYFRNPDSNEHEVQPEEILAYLYATAYSSLEHTSNESWENWKNDYKNHKYEIRFDKFADVEGFEVLASITEGKADLEAIQAIIDNSLEGLWRDLLYSERYKDDEFFRNFYEHNFFADVLYEKETGEPISTDLFTKTTRGATSKFSQSGFYSDRLFQSTYSSGRNWKSDLYDASLKKVKADEVLKVLASYCNAKEIEFSLEAFKGDKKYSLLYTELKDEDAIKFLDTPVRLSKLSDYFNDNDNYDDRNAYGKFLLATCFVKDSNYTTPAYKWRKSDNETIWWGCVSGLTPSYGKSLYGTYNNGSNGNGLIRIIDNEGNLDGQYISDLNDYKLSNLISSENGFYFRSALLDDAAEETGHHQVMYYNAETTSVENMFENVANNTDLEVVSFTVGGDYVYFCAARGITVINGKVNIKTKAYTTLSANRKLSQIISIK